MSRLSDATVRHLQGVAADSVDDRYELGEPIGEGGMGTVYRARDRELDREVAIKALRVLPPGEAGDLAARFRQEARILALLEHPGIVPVHDAGVLPDGRPFYVMTLVRGRRLDHHARDIPGIADRLRLFQRILEPVAFAHARGVIHRDLKPANVMVGPFGEVLVMDWGVAKVTGEAAGHAAGRAQGSAVEAVQAPAGVPVTGHGVVLGTAGFMAPEQALGESAAVDQRADVYALGAILQSLLEGPERAPRAIRAVAARAMARDQGLRYAAVPELAEEVARFLDGEPVRAYRESPAERLARFTTRYRTAIVLVLAYLVMRFLLLVFGRI